MKRLILLIFCLSSIVSWGQSIKGRVLDSKTKETIPQASITVTGVKGVGTSTDFDGNFTFTLPQGRNQITVSFVGYKSKTLTVTPGQNVTVSLDPDAAVLDDMVVVGMGSQKKESISGSVSTIDVGKAIDSRPVPDLGRALQGSTPGLTIRLSNGELGSDPTIRIRGNLTSIQGSSSPLILLDNVQIPSLQYINPDDVETVSILKDAASASIYGAKASNGVVLITSKKGSKTDRINVSYTGSFTMKTPTVTPKMAGLDNLEFLTQYSTSYRNKSQMEADNPISGGFYWLMNSWKKDRIEYWEKNYGGKDIGREMVYGRDWETISLNGGSHQNYGYRNYDKADILLKKWTPQQQHNISISGTSGKTNYNIGLGYLDQVGVTKNTVDTYNRYNVSLSVNSEVNKWLKVKSSFMYTLTEKCYPNITFSNDAYVWAYSRANAYFPMDATYNGEYMNDPMAEIRQSNITTRTKEYMRLMVGADLTFAKGWTGDFALTYSTAKNFYHEPGQRYYAVDSWLVAEKTIFDANGNEVWRNKDGNIVPAGTEDASVEKGWNPDYITPFDSSANQAYESSGRDSRVNMNAQTTYQLKLGDHDFKVMGGMQTESFRYYSHSSAKYGLSDQDKPEISLGEGSQWVTGSKSWESQLGYYGRINYGWKDKLFLEANGRYEAASKFPEDIRWKFFPSASAAYRISEENWFEPIKGVVSEMKIRASYGSLGNQGVSNNEYIPTLAKTQNSTWLGYDDVKFANYGSPALVRDDLTWETITTFNVAVDARFFKNKLGVTAEWYSRKTTDLIVPGGSVPDTFGGTAPRGNFGTLRTNGWELALDFNHRFANGMRLSATATVFDSKTKMLHYTESSTKTISEWYNGKTYGEIWGYKVDRLYQISDFEEYQGLVNGEIPSVDNQKATWFYGKPYNLIGAFTEGYEGYVDPYKAIGVPSPGNIKFKDLDENGVISSGNGVVGDSGDRTIIGNTLPRYEYSLRVDLDWKGFDLGVFFQGVGSRKVWGNGALASPNVEIGNAGVSSIIANTWTINNQDAWFPRSSSHERDVSTGGSWQVNDKYLIDMSYLRIKTITLGYTIPKSITEKAQLSKVRIYVTGENLFTIDNIKHFPIDPELQTGTSLTSAAYNGNQLGVTTPIQKFLSIGLQLNLK